MIKIKLMGDVKDYYEDNAENFGFRYLKYCCRRGKCVEVKRDVGDKTRVISYKPKESIELFPECKSCGYGKFYTSYENGEFIDRAWKSCLLTRKEVNDEHRRTEGSGK